MPTLRRSALPLLLAAALLTSGCTASEEPPQDAETPSASSAPAESPTQLDLTGEWSWHESPDPKQTMTATITDDRIEIRWPSFDVGEKGEPLSGTMATPLYWVGSFTPPQPGETSYTFTSIGDTAALETSLLASSEAEKTFTFADGKISFEITVQGESRTLYLTQD